MLQVEKIERLMKERILKLFHNRFLYDEEKKQEKELKVYIEELPEVRSDEEEINLYPYVLIQFQGGKKDDWNSKERITFYLVIGVWALDYTGRVRVINAIDTITNEFFRNRSVGDAILEMPLETAMDSEAEFPFYFGGIAMNFKVETPQEEGYYL